MAGLARRGDDAGITPLIRARIALPAPIMESLILGYFSLLNPPKFNDHCCVNGEIGKNTLKHDQDSGYMHSDYVV